MSFRWDERVGRVNDEQRLDCALLIASGCSTTGSNQTGVTKRYQLVAVASRPENA
jgi:hypothetical protein